jgi:hypothetical protein
VYRVPGHNRERIVEAGDVGQQKNTDALPWDDVSIAAATNEQPVCQSSHSTSHHQAGTDKRDKEFGEIPIQNDFAFDGTRCALPIRHRVEDVQCFGFKHLPADRANPA